MTCGLKPGCHIVVSVVSVVRKKFIGIEETLWSVCTSISLALRRVASRGAPVGFGVGDSWFKGAVM